MRRKLLAVAGSMIFMSVNALTSGAQVIRSDGPLPSFEVATIKPHNPKALVLLTPPGSENPVTQAGTAKTLIANAYGVRPARVLGGPTWIDDSSKVYVIEGKIPQELFARMQTMTGDQRHSLACLMLQSLLASRFDLKAQVESREMPVYELTLAKGGAKLPTPNGEKPSDPSGSRVQQMSGGEAITKNGVRISNMTLDDMLLPPWFDLGDRPIINKTGLAGKYSLIINWLPNIAAQRGPGTEITAPEGQPSIFTALEEQFGLKLVPAHDPVDIVLIDAIQPPSEN